LGESRGIDQNEGADRDDEGPLIHGILLPIMVMSGHGSMPSGVVFKSRYSHTPEYIMWSFFRQFIFFEPATEDFIFQIRSGMIWSQIATGLQILNSIKAIQSILTPLKPPKKKIRIGFCPPEKPTPLKIHLSKKEIVYF
jgi:hypothetical protein